MHIIVSLQLGRHAWPRSRILVFQKKIMYFPIVLFLTFRILECVSFSCFRKIGSLKAPLWPTCMSFVQYERLIVDLLIRKLRYERLVLLSVKAFSGYRQKYRSLIVVSTMSHALRSFARAPGDPTKMNPKFGGNFICKLYI